MGERVTAEERAKKLISRFRKSLRMITASNMELAIRDELRSLHNDTIERCCRAVCWDCMSEKPMEGKFHVTVGPTPIYRGCDAAKIRSLKEPKEGEDG